MSVKFEFCGAEIPLHWITGFSYSRKSKSITLELLNKGKIKNVYKDGDEADSEYRLILKQYEAKIKEVQDLQKEKSANG